MTSEKSVTTVEIAGEEYTVRSAASVEYTRECARYVNEAIEEIIAKGGLVEAHKAAILAAMALADQLFQARKDTETLRRTLTERTARLLEDIERRSPGAGLASAD